MTARHTFAACLLPALLLCARVGESDPPRTRQEFAAAMARLKVAGPDHMEDGKTVYYGKGMTKKEVLALLGPPDDILLPKDWVSDPAEAEGLTGEIWCWGTNGHKTLPTLGQLGFDGDQATVPSGAAGRPPPPGMFRERDLRRLLRLIHEMPYQWSFASPWDPRKVIQIINALQPLGEERALAAINEFARVTALSLPGEVGSDHWGGIRNEYLYVLPETLLNLRTKDMGYDPWFVWVLQDDVPLLLTDLPGGGFKSFSEAVLARFGERGKMRAKPLRPPDRPWEVLDRVQSPELIARMVDRRRLMDQILALLEPVYPLKVDPRTGSRVPRGQEAEAWWKQTVEELKKRDIRWDPGKNIYVIAGREGRSAARRGTARPGRTRQRASGSRTAARH